ncbi:hypothetical protein A2U01_0087945, partial [Trifolium medium]|nr:hypothetical protein [Trifolium medium]
SGDQDILVGIVIVSCSMGEFDVSYVENVEKRLCSYGAWEYSLIVWSLVTEILI